MKLFCFLIGLILAHLSGLNAQTQRALVIGINTYETPANYHTNKKNVRIVANLNGCVNDAKSIYDKLTTSFGFDATNIDTLYDTDATKKAILSSLKKLYDNSKEGDIAVLYYSGHGSHVKNSLTRKFEKQDQTIVPCDTYKDSVHDIRGTELNKYFNLFVDKKVKITVIFDCCESGSLARGPNSETSKARFLESENWDALDSSYYPAPEYRPGGYCMIMYASRSFEPAVEDSFDSVYHGAFTYSLLKAINGQSVNASANSIFQSARSILKNLPKPQEPLIAGDTARLKETLFGLKRSNYNNYQAFAIESLSEVDIQNNEFTIRVGYANQVSKKTQLVAMYDSSKDPLTLEILAVKGLNSSIAKRIRGDSSTIKPGSLFRISNLIADEERMVKVFIPAPKISSTKFNQYLAEAKILKLAKNIKWVDRLGSEENEPFATVFWKDQQWYLKLDTAKAFLLTDFSAKMVIDLCSKNEGFKRDPSIYLEMPIEPTFSEAVITKLRKHTNAYYQIVNESGKAHYILYSNLGQNNTPSYGFRRYFISKGIDLDPLPFKADINGNTAQSIAMDDSLIINLNKLAKIFYWVNLTSPLDDNKFLYHLEMFQLDSINPISNHLISIGDKLTLSLVKTEDAEAPESIIPNYYHLTVFRVSPDGSIICFEKMMNEVNTFPKSGELYDQKKIDILPFVTNKFMKGVYTYFLVATHDPYIFCNELEQSAVFDRNKALSRGVGPSKQYVQKISFRAIKKSE